MSFNPHEHGLLATHLGNVEQKSFSHLLQGHFQCPSPMRSPFSTSPPLPPISITLHMGTWSKMLEDWGNWSIVLQDWGSKGTNYHLGPQLEKMMQRQRERMRETQVTDTTTLSAQQKLKKVSYLCLCVVTRPTQRIYCCLCKKKLVQKITL